ncbi:hypothetical protein HGRIS_009846 [Hohenbuehelia grisea]|uniref:Alpha/beta-hydrolase n=1 Tax=Hohenbuehelia grisea TaxID=104357 RepID=A0ABR3J2Z6_9AGAR
MRITSNIRMDGLVFSCDHDMGCQMTLNQGGRFHHHATRRAMATTVQWKTIDSGQHIQLDLYPPSITSGTSSRKVPAVVYFHGGGLTVGNRTSWFPSWLQRRVTNAGYVFISTDYRLIPPATGLEIVEDIKDLFRFLVDSDGERLTVSLDHAGLDTGLNLPIDPDAIAVAGSSAGGLCAYLAAIHALPKPKALVSMYGMGGDFLIPHYLTPKNRPFLRGREILDPDAFKEFLYPASQTVPSTSDSALAYHDASYHIPGYPANPRMLLVRLYLQLGVFLDYYTGLHQPSLSELLRAAHAGTATDVVADSDTMTGSGSRAASAICIPTEVRGLFPQLNVSSAWPASFLCHGTADTAVPVGESLNMYTLLKGAGVDVELGVVEGKEHSFDYESGADSEGSLKALFDKIGGFVIQRLGKDSA